MATIAHSHAEGGEVLEFSGPLTRGSLPGLEKEALRTVKHASGRVDLDLTGVEQIDSAGAAFLKLIADTGRKASASVQIVGASEAVRSALSVYKVRKVEDQESAASGSRIAALGEKAYAWRANLLMFGYLTSDTMVWSIAGEKRTSRVRRGAIWVEANRIGVDSLGIVGLISFLVGTVVALQSAYQLKQFGADIFVANLIGVSMTREMGPLMTAIIIAGRSGAAIAAEIATMSVNEEVDALKTMGLEPTRYIVVPKFQAITLTMPGLTIYANLLGILGGFLVAVIYMDLGFATFMGQLIESLSIKDILTGLLKSLVFAWTIVLVAAHNGFQAYGGAESVGRVTTTSVVSSIFWVIVADSVLNMVFYF